MDLADDYLRSSLVTPVGEYQPTDKDPSEQPNVEVQESASYTLAYDQSQLSRDVDLWIRGSSSPTDAGVQGSRFPVVEQSTLARSAPVSRFWYILALVLPLLNVSNYHHWRCSPSVILNAAETLFSGLGRACRRLRSNLRRFTHNQASSELVATAMDVILLVYAFGFLLISMYQASVFN